MNSRQRFLETIRHGKPDRVPLLSEGMREDVLDLWHTQGMPPGKQLADLFLFDEREEITLGLPAGLDLVSLAEKKNGIDLLLNYLEVNQDSYMPEDWLQKVGEWHQREHILMLMVHWGFFESLGVSDWKSFSDVIYLIADRPDFVRSAMKIQGEFAAKLTDRFLQKVDVDAIIFSEPIGGNHGALISPRTYGDLGLVSYKPILDVVSRFGVDVIIWRTYANTRMLLPVVVDMGINCLWACECNPQAMNYLEIREVFGEEMGLIAGIDLDVLRRDKQSIRLELEAKIPPLLEQGRYIPLADGRVRRDIPYEQYAFYRRTLEGIIMGKLPETS
jgi:hypothetical protein